MTEKEARKNYVNALWDLGNAASRLAAMLVYEEDHGPDMARYSLALASAQRAGREWEASK